ncbi:cytochrome P450 [Frankia sp. CNm7]|uniref:Cytochrome P450 n=1 Tax=Frankia nepalensis TaxID=1836974 RepID=A0A937RI67_9ACTN|nr:cytochrome P450 [Frankia nepalensis]MBL7500159.1 cytochrome P450 [Frankia nepalensis]MBL7512390.1 cytochrome P450 [Frankia nepalensis]MBL7523923.1 cytochrome P450 [Frankia nepalensis]MBL7632706.1 cytochrome P450 [Frankia nepalensis]
MTEDLYWDPYDKVIDVDPHPLWRRMRDERPVYRNEKFDFYALSRFEDVDDAHLDPATYSSRYGTVLEIMTPEPWDTGQMIFMDPPVHTTLRVLVSRAFTPRRVGGLEGVVREICAELLDPLVGGGGFDYVQEFAAQLPSMVISRLIGVDPADREEVRRTIDETFHHDETAGMANEIAVAAARKLHVYFAEQIEARRAAPRDDLMTALVQAEVRAADGGTRRLSTREATDFTTLLTAAGTETVARLLGWACDLLAAHPDQRAELAADPSLIPNALEETLRYEAPSPVQGRVTTRDVELHGTRIPAKSKILLLTGSAGRDDRKYDDPDVYDIHRRFDSHVSLGHGIHFCLGAGLARLESRVAIEETLKRFPTWDIDRAAAVRLHTSTVRGYEKLPIVV